MNAFGQIVNAFRIEKGLTVTKMARRCRTHKGYISSINSGQVSPPAASMTRRIARALDLDPLDLIELGWAEKAPRDIRERVQQRLMQYNPLFQVVLSADPTLPPIVIPSREDIQHRTVVAS